MSEEFKVKVGVDVDVSNLQSQLDRKIKGNNKIKVDLDIKNANSRINELKKKIESLSNIKVNIGGLGKVSTSSGTVDGFVKNTNNQLKNASEAFKKLQGIQQEIKISRKNLSVLDSSTDSAAIDNLTKKINNLIVEYDKLYAAKSKSMSSIERSALNNEYSANIATIKQTSEAAKELLRVSKQIGSLEVKIKGLDGTTETNQVKELSSQLEALKKTYSELRASLNGQLSSGQLKGLNDVIVTTENKLGQLEAKIADTKRKAAESLSASINNGNIANQADKIEHSYKSIADAADNTRLAMERFRDAKTNLDTANENLLGAKDEESKVAAIDNLIAKQEEYKNALSSVSNQIDINKREEKDATDAAKATANAQKEAAVAMQLRAKADNLSLSMDSWLKNNSAAAKDFGGQIKSLQMDLRSCDAIRFSGIQSEFKNIQLQAEAAGKTGLSIADKFKNQFAKLSSYFGAASIIMTGIQAIKEAFQNVLDVDTKLTELYRVTDLTSSQYSDVYNELTASAQKYGATLTDLISQTADWSRTGFNDPKQAAGLSEITSVYQHIADLDAKTSMENLLTAYKGFQTQLDEQYENDATAAVTHIADVYNEIDNNYATTAADIGEAVKRSASALSLAGNSLEETAGMVTGITEVTQDPEKAGNSLKVLSMRIRGMKGELQDLGEETDENVENLSQMQGKVLNLTHGKVNIFGDDGSFKSTYEIMQGIADMYDDLTDSDKADLLETIAGKNRANEVAALIQNWDRVKQATDSAYNSAGSAMAENDKYVNSLQGRLDKLTSSLQTISNTALDSGFLKGLVSGATEAINILNKVIDTIGIIPTVAGVAGAALSLSGKKFFDFHIDEETGKLKLFGNVAKSVGSSVKEAFSNVGQVLGETFNKINSKFQGGENVFDFNSVKLNGDYGGARFVNSLDNDISKLKSFKSLMDELKDGLKDGMEIDVGAAIEQSMSGASNASKEFAKTWDGSNEALGEFTKKQLEATGVISKTSSSLTNAKNLISAYNNIVDKSGTTQQKFASSISTFNPQLGSYISGLKGAAGSLGGYGVQVAIATVKTFALEAATLALNTALTMGISALVSVGINALMSWINHAQEVADKVKDIRTEYENQQKTLRETKATVDDVSDSYAKLSKGVDTSTNQNLSLNADEYQEYLDIVNKIGDSIPELVNGYDDQGNAILSCAGNVDKLTEAYNNMAKAANNDVLKNAKDIAEDAKNDSKNLSKDKMDRDVEKQLEDLMKSNDVQGAVTKLASKDRLTISNALQGAGISKDFNESQVAYVTRAITQNKQAVNEYISEYKKDMDGASEKMRDIAKATIGNAFISGDYSNISAKMQDIVKNMIPNMDFDFFDKMGWDADKLNSYINDMLGTINNMDADKQKTFEVFFDMQTKYNNGECTVGDYVNSMEKIKSAIESSGLDGDAQWQLKMSLGIEDNDVTKQIDELKKSLENAGKDTSIIDGLTSIELKAAVSLDLDFSKMSTAEIKKAIEQQTKLLEAENFTIDIEGETDGLDKLNTALTESKSATGLAAESIDALKSRYKGLEGYNPSKLFEETSNGIRMNTQEYTKLERAYAQGKLKEATANLNTMKDEYNNLTSQIATCTDAEERANLVSKQEDIRQKINDLGELAAQYEGLASKYNAWQNAESAGSDRDMYENVLKGFDEVEDELSRGWLDDASKAFIDLFSYDELNSIDDYTNRWKTLGKTIDGTTYSVKDFFTQNEDGESTNDGVYNFLEAVDQLGKGNIKRGENGEIISFDFGVNGEDAIAKTMGISKELVQIIERAAEDAGFIINMDGTYTQFADLQKAAVESNKKINELAQSSEKLKNLGLDNYTFHFDSTDAETVFNDLNKAKEMLDTFRRDDGTIDLSVEGAQDALNIASTLQAAYDKLSDPVYMQLDASQVEDSMKKPLQLMQEYRTDQKTLNQMKLKGADTSELEKSMSNIVDQIAELDDETKVNIGIDTSKNIEDQKKEIQDKLNSGELTVDATVDLQVEANDTLKNIELLMKHQAGLISDEQLKIGLELDTTAVDDYTKDEATKIVKFLPENSDFLDKLGLEDDKKKIVVDFVNENSDFLNGLKLEDGQKEILLKYVAENPDLLKDIESEDQKKIAIDFVVNNQDVLDKLDDEKQRKVVIDFVAKNEGILDDIKTDEEKEVVVNFIANNESVLNGLDDEKQRKVIIDFVAKNPQFFDSLGLNDDQKKVAIEFVAENQDILKDFNYEQKQVVVDFVAKNADFFDNLDDDEKTIAIDFVANNQDLIKDLDDEDKQVAIEYIAKNPDALDGLNDEEKQVKINAIVSGEEGIDQINNDINGLNDKQIQVIAKTLGNIDVENLKSAIAGLSDKQVQAIATAMGKGDVDGLKSAINGMSDKQVQAIATALGFSDVESLKSAVAGLDGKQVQAVAQALGISDVNSLRGAVNGLDGKTVQAIAEAIGSGAVDGLQSKINSLTGKTVNVVANLIGSAAKFITGGGGGVDGTAHVNGTAFANGTTGKAFKQGDWGTKEDGTALMGELGTELLVRNGRWYTVGEDSAEFVGYKKGDIIFNADQTREIFEKGKITHGNGRGKALAEGTAFSNGSGGIGRSNKGSSVKTSKSRLKSSSKSSSSSSKSSSSSSSDAADEFEETLDWIEIALDRVERAISNLDRTASSTYKTWSARNSALNDQIGKTRDEIDLQQRAYERYMQQAGQVGLSEEYAAKVRNGTIDIQTITDEDLNDKIKDYQNWYEKALDCKDAIDELRESESKLYEQRFNNVATRYDGYLGVIEHEKDMLDEFITQNETQGHVISTKYYDALIANEKKNIAELKKERDELTSELNTAVSSGAIARYSEAWYDMVSQIDDVTKSIEEGDSAILDYSKSIREVNWEVFDMLQDRISKVADESQFLIDLMDNKKLYQDNGQLTEDGMATMGQHGVKYNVYMAQANKYAKEMKKIDEELAKDPYNKDVLERRQELLEAQQKAILNAEDEKNAIKDMVADGIDKELDSLQKLIDKYNDSLDAQKDLYDYQKKVKKQTKDIADLEKQMAAYRNDTSEEAKAKIQKIKVDLEDAKSDLEETEYDQYISDQQKILDDLYDQYEVVLNMRLDDVDALMQDMIAEINANASTIGNTIAEQADKVGYTLSDSMNTIWLSGNGSISNVITMYGNKFDTALTTTNTALGNISTNIANMISQLNKLAGTNIKAAVTSSAATEKPVSKPSTPTTTQQPQQQQKKQISVGGKINAGNARIYADSYGNGGGTQTFRSDPIYTVLSERNGYVLTRWYKLSSGYTGWFKKSEVNAYKVGAKSIDKNQMAWTQEDGSEMIMRPSDGAILTPLAKSDSVLTSAASGNIWNMANSPADFIKDNLDLDRIDTNSATTTHANYTQNLDKVVFNLPNVKNYDEMLSAMQRDRNFERLISSMTIDRLAGKSSLAKGKAIR